MQLAIEEVLALLEWQLRAITEAIAALERGDVVDHRMVTTALRYRGRRAN